MQLCVLTHFGEKSRLVTGSGRVTRAAVSCLFWISIITFLCYNNKYSQSFYLSVRITEEKVPCASGFLILTGIQGDAVN